MSAVIPMFRNADGALSAVQHLLDQALPVGVSLEVIVVDDGSGDGSANRLRASLPGGVRLLELTANRGRSAARQAGIDAATGDAVLFLDCDCEPTDKTFVANHLRHLRQDAVASTGPIIGFDGGFWDRYQRSASRRRRKLFERGIRYSASTQNMMVRASAVRAAGGFDARYRHYGFEDRDLLVRLAALGPITMCDDVVVRHRDRINMVSVSEKMQASGRGSSRLFATEHPAEYQALGYASLDIHNRAWLRPAACILRHFLRPMSRAFDLLERHHLLPWTLGFAAARAISAASYLVGTTSVSDV